MCNRPAVSMMTVSSPMRARRRVGGLGDLDRVGVARGRVDGAPDLPSQRRQLLDRGGTIDVRGHQIRTAALLDFQIPRELRGRRRLARSLKTDEHDRDGRWHTQVERHRLVAHRARQLLMDELDEVLLGREAPQHFLPERLLPNALDERLDDGEGDVGLEEGHPDFPHRLGHVALRDTAVAAESLEDQLELVA